MYFHTTATNIVNSYIEALLAVSKAPAQYLTFDVRLSVRLSQPFHHVQIF